MKALDSYKTVRGIREDLAKENLEFQDDWKFIINTTTPDIDKWGYPTFHSIGFQEEESTFSCAVREIGEFDTRKDLNWLWPYLLKAYLLGRKPDYSRCSTLATEEYEELNDALQQVGFLPVTQVKSNHGKYKVLLWEYFGK